MTANMGRGEGDEVFHFKLVEHVGTYVKCRKLTYNLHAVTGTTGTRARTFTVSFAV